MSNKPKIYAHCKAGCLWETPHKVDVDDEFAKVRLEIAEQIQASGNIQIASGSYTGTGTYGQSNPTQINLGFTPRYVFLVGNTDCDKSLTVIIDVANKTVLSARDSSAMYKSTSSSDNGRVVEQPYPLQAQDGITRCTGEVTIANGVMSLWASYSAWAQYNASGRKYSYFAIG